MRAGALLTDEVQPVVISKSEVEYCGKPLLIATYGFFGLPAFQWKTQKLYLLIWKFFQMQKAVDWYLDGCNAAASWYNN